MVAGPSRSAPAARREPAEPPPKKKTALEELLGGTFSSGSSQAAAAAAPNPIIMIEKEMDKYTRETCIPLKSCPLKWWRENAKYYPMLSRLAKVFLSIPATSVPSERVFSTAGDIVTAERAQLLPENVDRLVFLKKNLP